MSTSRSEACLPPNPQLFLISSSYLPASLVIVHSKTTVWEGFKENNQLVASLSQAVQKTMWISETVRHRNKRTRPGFEDPVISKSTGMNQKSENGTQWRLIQMCSLWSVICICRTGLPDDLLELSKHLEEVKEEGVPRDHLSIKSYLISLSYHKADFHAICPQDLSNKISSGETSGELTSKWNEI